MQFHIEKVLPRLFLTLLLFSSVQFFSSVDANTFLRMQTDLGAVDIELFDDDAPLTVENFLNYVNGDNVIYGSYDGTFIHRISPLFVVQAGGYRFDPDSSTFSTNIETGDPVVNEPGRSNLRGTIAMARIGGNADSATSEWFVNLNNNTFLDNQPEGSFTVFAEVLGTGIEVFDAIAALDQCANILPDICVDPYNPPFVEVVTDSSEVTERTLVNINSIGIDTDGDGVIDKVEDDAPNGGDANEDGIADSEQQHVASFPWTTGEYIVIESPEERPLQALNILSETYALANLPDPEVIGENDFFYGYAGFDIAVPDQEPVAVTITLPPGGEANKYFNFGPTIEDAEPHWYEFNYDSETGTGAVFEDNTVTLYFIDGARGDASPGVPDGVITTLGGPALNDDLDDDGIFNAVEDGALNNGDGNNDGIPDSQQAHVNTLLDVYGNYITLAADTDTHRFSDQSIGFGLEFLLEVESLEFLNNRNFPHGFLTFTVNGLTNGGSTSIQLVLPAGKQAVSYLKYGPTPEKPFNHLYEFIYDGETGAEFDGNIITLHFVDGKRGDSDLTVNGSIFDPGAPAVAAPAPDRGGSSGCSLGRPGSGPLQGGAWWLLLSLLAMYRLQVMRLRK